VSIVKIRAALESALNSMTPALTTAWENNAFTPPALTVPYQEAVVLFAEPVNTEFGSNFQEQGFMQVKLKYPLQAGSAAAAARAQLLRSTFSRGSSFTNNGVTVTIGRTPEIAPSSVEDGRWVVPVKIRFFANI
jgi:hypothetical protein